MGPFFLSKKFIESDENGMIINVDKFIDTFKNKVIMYLYEDAVRQKRHKFFEGCSNSRYSEVCKEFDRIGLEIFGHEFENTYYNTQRNEI